MRSVALLVAAAGLFLLAAAAPASARPAKGDAAGPGEAGACIARRQLDFGTAWLNTLAGSPEEAALIATRRKDVDSCLKKSGSAAAAVGQPELREGMASELLKRRFPRLPATAPFPPGTSPWFAAKLISAPNARFDRAAARTEIFANCVALSQWSDTVALLAADPVRATQAAEALRPALGACLTPSLTVKFKVESLRSMLANAVYHIMSTASLNGAAAAKS